ncbi:hypothetical protein FOXB_09860 [Fusarium oxysporum f. sp. conglutinans Fo5176]|uniref:Cullin N-terminal domain-containing protein n=1 Tax=Fusarium oxysporum (strain Fo5176) TaxID=660025 RepID=F9FTX9_FUSOF|nr:hypothetical protein FOXB_09860 [Fusarium oxysporum f. sp. conglutinans Fo5176]
MSYHSAVYLIVLEKSKLHRSSDEVSGSVYEMLDNFMKECLQSIAKQLGNHDNDQFLASLIRQIEQITFAMELICDIFMYVDWVHTQNGGECIKSLILRRREDSFIWKVEVEMREKLRLAAWMTIANGKGETILHPDIKRMVANTFGIAKQIAVRQPIFLWTRPLVVVERHFAGFKGFLKRFPEICHWAVSVGNGPLYELRKYEPGRARPKPPRDFTAKGWTRRQIGYTLLTHDQVEECDGKYSATSNNCQKYVINLFECIREQDNVRDLFEDIRGFSCILNDRILRLRFQQYLRAWYLPSSDSVATPVEPMPMLIEQCIRNVLSAPPAIVAALSGMRFGSWFFICLMPAIGLYATDTKLNVPGIKLNRWLKGDTLDWTFRRLYVEDRPSLPRVVEAPMRQRPQRALTQGPGVVQDDECLS